MSINPTLARNLVALSAWSVDSAAAVEQAPETSPPSIDHDNFAGTVEWLPTYALVVMGFGAEVRTALRRAAMPPALRRRRLFGRKGELLWVYPTIVYEPDLARVRAVLSRVDMAEEIAAAPLVILASAEPAEISAALFRYRESVAMGTFVVDAAEPGPRLLETREEFLDAFARYAGSAHMDVYTAATLTRQVTDNAFANIDLYARHPGITDLAGWAADKPAISVAAGPSLTASLEVLARPEVRDRFVIISAQTTLKLLLSRGIRPHFVTAIDYHDSSARFYEGLMADDVRGIQLVARAQCSPVIPRSFPGVVRFFRDEVLDAVLADERERGALRAGGSVAHTSYFLARYMGCDPVVLVGHDLGFADPARTHAAGAPGQVGKNIVATMDIHGRPFFTDAQMAAYLDQFQREFAADAALGLTTLDATGGGVRKRHAEPVELAEIVRRQLEAPAVPLSPPTAPEPLAADPAVAERVAKVRRGLLRVTNLERRAGRLLSMLRASQHDDGRRTRITAALDAMRDEAVATEPALSIVNYVDQAGGLRRIRENRRLHLSRVRGRPI